MPVSALHNYLMIEALRSAERGVESGGVPIGAVLARPCGRLIARGFNRTRLPDGSPTDHAEMGALASVPDDLDRAARGDLVLATTLEPCVMCLGAAVELGIGTIVYGLEAPANGGCGRLADLDSTRIVGGVRRQACRNIVRSWLANGGRSRFLADLVRDTAPMEPVPAIGVAVEMAVAAA